MVQIIKENKRPSFAEQFSNAIGSGLQGINQIQNMQREQQASQTAGDLLSIDLSGFDPETRKALMVEKLKQEGKNARNVETQDFFSKLKAEKNKPGMDNGSGKDGKSSYQSPSFSKEDILEGTILNPNLGRQMSHIQDVELRENREERNLEQQEKNRQRKEQLDFHKESQKYDEDLIEKTRRAKNQIETFKDIEKAIDSGNVKPGSWTNILRNFGDIGRSMSNAIMNKDEATILSSIPQLLEGWKQVFGVRLTDADLKVLQDKLPDIGKSDEANKSILKVMKKYGDMSLLRSKIASEIKKSNQGLRPLGYANMIEERFDEMIAPVKVINPKTGNTIEIPAYKLSDAINAGASLSNE